jgi:thymidylate synthase
MYNTTEDIRNEFAYKLKNEEFVTDKTGVKTLELINASFEVTEPTIFGKRNDEYVARELEWYNSESLYVKDIPGKTPAIWESVSSDNGQINSNYGYLIFGENNYSQYESVRTELGENPDSRRANMIYTRPSMHIDAFQSGMNDFVCTNNVQYFIRDNQLVTSVYMRSNDVIFGFNNDFAWQEYVRNKLIDDLETDTYIRYEAGPIYWNVGSLHVYERHFDLVKEWDDAEYEQMELTIRQIQQDIQEERRKDLAKKNG